MCDEAFEYDLILIKYFPDDCITKQMCNAAFKRNIGSIKYIPPEFITDEMLDIISN